MDRGNRSMKWADRATRITEMMTHGIMLRTEEVRMAAEANMVTEMQKMNMPGVMKRRLRMHIFSAEITNIRRKTANVSIMMIKIMISKMYKHMARSTKSSQQNYSNSAQFAPSSSCTTLLVLAGTPSAAGTVF